MKHNANPEHQIFVSEIKQELIDKGFEVILLNGLSPDAVAAKDGKIYAIEALGMRYKKKKGFKHSWTFSTKAKIYNVFDGLIFKTFKIKGKQIEKSKIFLHEKDTPEHMFKPL